jgi:flavin-dependent dehydrogenase
MKKEAETEYPVVILGGGPAGCATAIALADRGITGVPVIEAGNHDALRIGECIPPDTLRLLARLGVHDEFVKEGHDVCYGSCSSWGSDELGYNDFLFNPHGNGRHLDRRRFDTFLARSAVQRGAELRTRTRFLRAAPCGDEGFVLTFHQAGGETFDIRAGYVVDATGHHGAFAKAMGAQPQFVDRLICVYGFFELNPASEISRMTMLEAVEQGWWYAARLPGDRLAVAFASDPEIVKRHGLAAPPGWQRLLGDTRFVAEALAGCRFISGSLRAWPALSLLRTPAAGACWLAAGDAASLYDPISSQGIHKALAEGLAAGKALAERMSGESENFEEYDAAVKRRFESYLANRDYLYGLECRWPDSPFWRRRGAVHR